MAALEPKFWTLFCAAAGHPEWEDAPATTPAEIAALKARIGEVLATRDLAQWAEVFADVDCCVEPVLTPVEATQHPQLVARGMVVQVPDTQGGTQPQVATPVRFSATTATYARTAVHAGTDTHAVLLELGYDADTIARLRSTGAVAGA